jgi:hypothetical protein
VDIFCSSPPGNPRRLTHSCLRTGVFSSLSSAAWNSTTLVFSRQLTTCIHRQAAWWNGSRKRVSEEGHPLDPWLNTKQPRLDVPPRETDGERGDWDRGSVLWAEEYTTTSLVRVTESPQLLLCPCKILGKETKKRFPCYGMFSAI